ncbi:hypothetical protein DFH06DRAFT_1218223, partial [Mycena polygramma]
FLLAGSCALLRVLIPEESGNARARRLRNGVLKVNCIHRNGVQTLQADGAALWRARPVWRRRGHLVLVPASRPCPPIDVVVGFATNRAGARAGGRGIGVVV